MNSIKDTIKRLFDFEAVYGSSRKYECSFFIKLSSTVLTTLFCVTVLFAIFLAGDDHSGNNRITISTFLSIGFLLSVIVILIVYNISVLTFSITIDDGRIYYHKYFRKGELDVNNIRIAFYSLLPYTMITDGNIKLSISRDLIGYSELRDYLENIAIEKSGSKLFIKVDKYLDVFYKRRIYCPECKESFTVSDISPRCPKCGNKHLGRPNLMLFRNPKVNDTVMFVILVVVSVVIIMLLFEYYKSKILIR